MFERFTERASRVVALATQEARLLDHDYVGTEHILLALLHEDEGVAARALDSFGVTLQRARGEVEQLVGRGSSTPPGDIPFTERTKSVLGLSLREALHMGRDYIETEHLLLALLHVEDGLAPVVVARLAGKPAVVRARVMELTDAEAGGDPTSAERAEVTPLSRALRDVVTEARREAVAWRAPETEPIHLLLAAVRDADGAAGRMLREVGVDPDDLRRRVTVAQKPCGHQRAGDRTGTCRDA